MDVIINLNKPRGLTSQQAVTRVKRAAGAKKAGHTGTLDPLATGVLLVCLGEATKVSRFFLDMDKQYRARLKLGVRTDTYDSEGRVIEEKEAFSVTGEQVAETVAAFRGSILQKPPMYSAVKIGGNALYKLARKGIEVERRERRVQIYDIAVSGFAPPFVDLLVSCSKGTYIRTLCDDIGSKIGVGAHLVSLVRTKVGPFELKDSISLDDLSGSRFFPPGESKILISSPLSPFGAGPINERCVDSGRFVSSIDSALDGLEAVVLNEPDFRKARNGLRIAYKNSDLPRSEFIRLKDPSGNLFGIGRVDSGMIVIERILNLVI